MQLFRLKTCITRTSPKPLTMTPIPSNVLTPFKLKHVTSTSHMNISINLGLLQMNEDQCMAKSSSLMSLASPPVNEGITKHWKHP